MSKYNLNVWENLISKSDKTRQKNLNPEETTNVDKIFKTMQKLILIQ